MFQILRVTFLMLFAFSSILPATGNHCQEPRESRRIEPSDEELDAFMSKVLEKREINWDHLHGYVFSEIETLEIRGIKLPPMANFRREYVWIVRDGYLVRSPVRMNGVKVSKEEQADAEERWLGGRKNKREDAIERDMFFRFKFQPGSYLYAGRRDFEGREVVAIEYYPSKAREDQGKEGSKGEEEYERMFEKTILVTMLIQPKEHQIVHISFDNIGLEFLPLRWLVRFDELRASMTMDKPLGDVWLPKRIVAAGNLDTAGPSMNLRYTREFYDYGKTDVRVKLRFEKIEPGGPKP